VIGQGKEAIFVLNRLANSVDLRENRGFAEHEIGTIRRALSPHLNRLLLEWERIHGPA
jgi:hypothetical protein